MKGYIRNQGNRTNTFFRVLCLPLIQFSFPLGLKSAEPRAPGQGVTITDKGRGNKHFSFASLMGFIFLYHHLASERKRITHLSQESLKKMAHFHYKTINTAFLATFHIKTIFFRAPLGSRGTKVNHKPPFS